MYYNWLVLITSNCFAVGFQPPKPCEQAVIRLDVFDLSRQFSTLL